MQLAPQGAACASPETGLANLFPDRAVGVSGGRPQAFPCHPSQRFRVFNASGHAGVHGRASYNDLLPFGDSHRHPDSRDQLPISTS